MHFERRMPFKMHKIAFFPDFFFIKNKYVCLPDIKFSDLLPETHIHLHFYVAFTSDF